MLRVVFFLLRVSRKVYFYIPRLRVSYKSTKHRRADSDRTTECLYAAIKNSRTKCSRKRSSNEIAANPSVANEGLKTYLGMGTPRRPQLAVALPRVGETMRKNKFNKTSNKTEKDISHKDDGSQRWRFTKIQGTDEHLKDIFMGKCWDYQIKFRLEKPVDCSELWEAFLSGFAYKEPCDTTLEDYKKFFEMIHEGPLVNRVSFYSSMVWKLGGSNISNK